MPGSNGNKIYNGNRSSNGTNVPMATKVPMTTKFQWQPKDPKVQNAIIAVLAQMLYGLVSTKQIRFILVWIMIWNVDIICPFSVHQCIKLDDFIAPTIKLETPQRILCCHWAQGAQQARPLRWVFFRVCDSSSISALHCRVIKLKILI